MRLRKNDPTGNYWYDADGVDPASNVLSDGYSTFTPGIGETHGTGNNTYASVFYLADAQGNSRGLLDGSQNNPDGYNWDAFGNSVSRFGTNPTAYAWNEESGYQSDNDSGLKLLGHRYYDSRTGRFISQDPAGAGDNWYAYCGNDPVNRADPSGNVAQTLNGGSASIESPGYGAALSAAFGADLNSALMASEASYEAKTAKINGFTPGETTSIRDTLSQMLTTDRGVEMLAEGYNDNIPIDIEYQKSSFMRMVTISVGYDIWPAYTNPYTKQINIDTWGLLYCYADHGGYTMLSLDQTVIHELGHLLTGIGDTGLGHNDNVLANENPVESALGMEPRNSYSHFFAYENPYGFPVYPHH